jgi:hypothetical protein
MSFILSCTLKTDDYTNTVIPAKAGIHTMVKKIADFAEGIDPWVPAFAGMTDN